MKHLYCSSNAVRLLALFVSVLLYTTSGVWNLRADNCTAPPPGLVGWWQAEGSAADSAGTNSGTLINGAAFAPGKVGQAFAFNGVNQFVQIPDAPALDLTNAISVEAWVYITAYPDISVVSMVTKQDSSSSIAQYQLTLWNPGTGWHFRPAMVISGQWAYFGGATVPQPGTWYHLVTTYDGASLKLYVNGVLDGSQPVSGPILTTSGPLLIGGGGVNWFFNGRVDEVSLYSRALFDSEIQALYNAGSAGKCTTPVAPQVVIQPTNQTATVGETVNFSVFATGTSPLYYQWQFNGNATPGATGSSLVLSNVQLTNAGTYSVIVSNSAGTLTSSNATLSVNPAPPCATAPPGLMSWWRAEADTSDTVGGQNGTLMNGAGFAPGKVGQAFTFNGVNQFVQIPDAPILDLTNAISVEAWVYINAYPAIDVVSIVTKQDPSASIEQYQLALWNTAGSWRFRPVVVVSGGQWAYFAGATAPQLGTWYHLVMTYDGASLKLYVNGVLDGSQAVSGPILTTSGPLLIGGGGVNWFFNGRVDEVSLYDRSLSASEVQAIYAAADGGKCVVPIAPSIVTQPTDRDATVGDTVTFSVGAAGTSPFSYQWSYNGTSITGATNSSLTFTNVQIAQEGTYTVVVTNLAGSVTSSNAVLTVNFPPALIYMPNVSTDAGNLLVQAVVTLPIYLVANGNENALGVSLNFSPSVLSNLNIQLGIGATGATLISNISGATNGNIGLLVALPTGSTFGAGTQEVAEVTFGIVAQTNVSSTKVSFGDTPISRQLSDPSGRKLSANYADSTVSINIAFEGDVSPRPGGDKDVSVTDWVLMGRYAAQLDFPTNASEFQRADCAPRSTLGDGHITVADWVQAGRYAARLDPLTLVGGPTNDLGPNIVGSQGSMKNISNASAPASKDLGPRQLKIMGASLIQGHLSTISVTMSAQGNENAASFSITFDPSILSFASAELGADAVSATMNVNSAQAANGRVAFALALPPGDNWAAGNRELVKVRLIPTSKASGVYALSLTDQPVVRQIVDSNAASLAADFIGGSVTLNPMPTLTITRNQQNISLSWPSWATNFSLQESIVAPRTSVSWTNTSRAPIITNGQAVVNVPATGTSKFYRLQEQ